MSGLRTVCVGFWLLGSLCLSFGASMVAYNKGTSANLSECLNFSKYLMTEAEESLKQMQEKFNSCSMETIRIRNPNNEAKILHACTNRTSKLGPCFFGKNDAVNQTLCMETIHGILASYAKEVSHSKSFGFPKFLPAVNDMMQALKINNKTLEEAPYKPESFSSWYKQCKFLLIFQELAQTINRIMNYLRFENSEQNA